jgi:hypothetical protein
MLDPRPVLISIQREVYVAVHRGFKARCPLRRRMELRPISSKKEFKMEL